MNFPDYEFQFFHILCEVMLYHFHLLLYMLLYYKFYNYVHPLKSLDALFIKDIVAFLYIRFICAKTCYYI